MEKFEFEKFVEDNNLDVSQDFSIPIQKQVKIFNELKQKREDTIDEDREEVDRKLKERALKILSDMETEMEDRLANNEVVEVEKPKEAPKKEVEKKTEPVKKELPKPVFKQGQVVEITGGDPKYKGVVAEIVEHYAPTETAPEKTSLKALELPNGKAVYSADQFKATTKKPTVPSSDEKLIEQYFKKGIYKVGRSELKENGFKGSLEGKEIKVGKFQLTKFKFSYNYAIKIIKK